VFRNIVFALVSSLYHNFIKNTCKFGQLWFRCNFEESFNVSNKCKRYSVQQTPAFSYPGSRNPCYLARIPLSEKLVSLERFCLNIYYKLSRTPAITNLRLLNVTEVSLYVDQDMHRACSMFWYKSAKAPIMKKKKLKIVSFLDLPTTILLVIMQFQLWNLFEFILQIRVCSFIQDY